MAARIPAICFLKCVERPEQVIRDLSLEFASLLNNSFKFHIGLLMIG